MYRTYVMIAGSFTLTDIEYNFIYRNDLRHFHLCASLLATGIFGKNISSEKRMSILIKKNDNSVMEDTKINYVGNGFTFPASVHCLFQTLKNLEQIARTIYSVSLIPHSTNDNEFFAYWEIDAYPIFKHFRILSVKNDQLNIRIPNEN